MKKILFSVALALAALCSPVIAQDKVVIATGDAATSVYSIMFKQLIATCSKGDWVEQNTKGGIENKNLLIGNKVNGTIVQADMLEFEKRIDATKVEGIRTLFTLHKEELHFIARGTKKEGGLWGVGATVVNLTSLASLKGRVVGAVGGSVSSANVVSTNSGLNFRVLQVDDNKQLKDKLTSGEIDAILVVGGSPHPLVESLSSEFKILPIPPDLIAKLAASKLYFPAKLSYANMGASGVESVATQALFVTRVYRSQTMLAKMKDMRTCFQQKLGDIQDKTGTHPKWQFVDVNDRGSWPWYELGQ